MRNESTALVGGRGLQKSGRAVGAALCRDEHSFDTRGSRYNISTADEHERGVKPLRQLVT
jgi:hypothetical protein